MTATQLALFDGLPPTKGTVYYGIAGGRIKIGYTGREYRKRGGELRLTLLLAFPGDREAERRHHDLWAKYRIGMSEWFYPEPILLEWLDRNVQPGTTGWAALRELIFRPARRVA